MNQKQLDQIRYDLAQEVLRMGKEAPVDLELVLDCNMDNGARFAEEAAAILSYDGESASEYSYRVQNWLLGLIEKSITDEHCRDYARKCDDAAEVERQVDERIEAMFAAREAA